ncbi:MAG: response regulator [Coriobacteriia bacterium]|nr:response regulator [Coriobacteriia bacterium]
MHKANAEQHHILLIEDSATIRQVVSMTLHERGYAVKEAPDGVSGLHMLAEYTPDAVLLDLNLPDIDGFEVCKRIKADPHRRNIPVIVMTGLGEPGFEIMAIEAGADDFVIKPVDPMVLDARIQMVVRRMHRERFTNALTELPASTLTEERIAFQLSRKQPFGIAYIDIDGFRAFNLRYGFSRGDLLLRHVASLILEAVQFESCEEQFVGHMGADDFVAICDIASIEKAAHDIADAFDTSVMDYYEDEDRERGSFILQDRTGGQTEYGPLTISIAVLKIENYFPDSIIALADVSHDLLVHARTQPGSNVVVERRRQPGA